MSETDLVVAKMAALLEAEAKGEKQEEKDAGAMDSIDLTPEELEEAFRSAKEEENK
ncbi:MAG: hypothetical protein BWZ10_01112 [candidate division BRC1 bacterium ADurb.BinA364]|nr:MAG: hypothetical protein BWZ10_01112 [candidate division BRC1 bacterium ADurb.BinA364]